MNSGINVLGAPGLLCGERSQNTLEGLHISPGLGRLGNPPEEPQDVSGSKDVRTTLFSLLSR